MHIDMLSSALTNGKRGRRIMPSDEQQTWKQWAEAAQAKRISSLLHTTKLASYIYGTLITARISRYTLSSHSVGQRAAGYLRRCQGMVVTYRQFVAVDVTTASP